jgi:(E)-4-hydroxy-3-methylbut-2-enyl-diphosphate synthase
VHFTTPITGRSSAASPTGEACETDTGFIGSGNVTHQVYINGPTDHRLKNADILDHLVELVEAEIEAAKRQEPVSGLATVQ